MSYRTMVLMEYRLKDNRKPKAKKSDEISFLDFLKSVIKKISFFK
ncbi:MAG: hypothetical protein ACNI3C_11400 [Candidatus Marinarcus sp.]